MADFQWVWPRLYGTPWQIREKLTRYGMQNGTGQAKRDDLLAVAANSVANKCVGPIFACYF